MLCQSFSLAGVPNFNPCNLISHGRQVCDCVIIYKTKHCATLAFEILCLHALLKALAGVKQVLTNACTSMSVKTTDFLCHCYARCILLHLAVCICIGRIPLAGYSLYNTGCQCTNALETEILLVNHCIRS